jgi:hypothetical protein
MIDAAVEEFGALIGMDRLGLDAEGSLVLEIEPSDTLCLVRRGQDLCVSISRERQYPGEPSASRMLELLHFERTGGLGIRCRRTDFGRSTVLMELLPGGPLRGGDLLQCFDRLTALHNTAEAV